MIVPAGLPSAVTAAGQALQHLAVRLDENWFPGVTPTIDPGPGPVPPPSPPLGPPVTPVELPCRHLLPQLWSLRYIVDRETTPGVRRLVRAYADLGGVVLAVAGPVAASWHAAVCADLWWRAGDGDLARELLRTAARHAPQDPCAQALVACTAGDWLADPDGRPETFGILLTRTTWTVGRGEVAVDGRRQGGPAARRGPRDPARAATYYRRALSLWTAAGSRSGAAAAHLRLARLAGLAGLAGLVGAGCAPQDVDVHLDQAVALALRSGNQGGALVALVHQTVTRLERGPGSYADLVDDVSRWSGIGGSRSLIHGVVQLLTSVAARERAADRPEPAWRLLRAAEAVAARAGLPGPDPELTQLYGGVYRRAQIVLGCRGIEQALNDAAGPQRGALDWIHLAARAGALVSGSAALGDPAIVAAVRDLLLRLVDAAPARPTGKPTGEPEDAAVDPIRRHLVGQACLADAVVPLYAAREARRDGYGDEAEGLLAQAAEALDRVGEPVLRCAVLAHARDRATAARLAIELDDAGLLGRDDALRLFLRLGDAERALAAWRRERPGATTVDAPPWEEPGLLARLCHLRGEREAALHHATMAVREFERLQSQLTRDTLRTAATDDPDLARVFQVLVLSLLSGVGSKSDSSAEGGDPPAVGELPGVTGPLPALAAADRTRGLSLPLLAGLSGLDAPSRAAAGAWLAAGSRWAAAYQALARAGDGDAPGRDPAAAIRDVDAGLDDAEAVVARCAPALLRARAGEPPALAPALARIPDGGLLLAYFVCDDELVVWAATPERLTARRVEGSDYRLIALVGRLRADLAGRVPDPGGNAAAELADLLLGPVRTWLEHSRRLIVVPHRELALVPFHALPWDGEPCGARRPVSVLPAVSLLTRSGPLTRSGLQSRSGLRTRPDLGRGSLVVGDPDLPNDFAWHPLPGTRTEAFAVAEILGAGRPLVGSQATVEAVVGAVPGRGVVHLATHGEAPPRSPDLARIVLAGGRPLRTADLLGLNLDGALVTLSACHTGEGVTTAAGEVEGLARAVLIAGAASVVVSLWPVEDETGCLVMTGFYRQLAAGQDTTTALATAQAAVRGMGWAERSAAYAELAARYGTPRTARHTRDAVPVLAGGRPPQHPSSWAPFVHVGI